MVMARRVGLLMFVVLAVAAEQVAAKADPAVEASLKAGRPFVEGELLVQFKPGASEAASAVSGGSCCAQKQRISSKPMPFRHHRVKRENGARSDREWCISERPAFLSRDHIGGGQIGMHAHCWGIVGEVARCAIFRRRSTPAPMFARSRGSELPASLQPPGLQPWKH